MKDKKPYIAALMALVAMMPGCGGRDGGAGSSSGGDSVTAVGSVSHAPEEGEDKEIWTGMSGGFRIRWTELDISTGNEAGVVFSLRDRINGPGQTSEKTGITPEMAAAELRRQGCRGGSTGQILSAVGPILSFAEDDEMKCPAFVHISRTYAAVDLAHPNRTLLLTDLFAENDLLRALLADSLVKETLGRNAWALPPATSLDELFTQLRDITPACDYQLSSRLLGSFAFHHIKGDRVEIRVGLSSPNDKCMGKLTEMRLLLPIPPQLAGALRNASEGTDGILMPELEALAGTRTALLMDINE